MEKSISARAMTRRQRHDSSRHNKIVQGARDSRAVKNDDGGTGRALTAASLMGALLKSENNTLTLQFRATVRPAPSAV